MNKKNLLILATYLLSGKLKLGFDMETFEEVTECGTTACALGHGPSAGLLRQHGESWLAYCGRVFGISCISGEFSWCFSPSWSEIDNTPEGAGKRILYLLRHGLPTKRVDYSNENL